MRILWILILCWNCVESVTHEGYTCRLNQTDRFENAIGVCKGAYKMISESKVTDLSHITHDDFNAIFYHRLNFECSYDFRMIDNPYINSLKFGRIEAKRIEIRRNKKLKEFNLSLRRYEEIRISGNPQLSKDSLHEIRYDAYSIYEPKKFYIQEEEGECEFDNPVKDVVEFEFCKYVEGDLIMENTVGAHVNEKLHTIKGCLRIINTELKDIEFLDGIRIRNNTCKSLEKSEISGNKNLWLHSRKKEELKKIVPLEIKMHPEAVGTCSPDEVFSKDFDCTHVTGDLNINKPDMSLHNLKTIRHVDGIIKIQGTNFDSISFPDLTSFGNANTEDPALMIMDNPQFTYIDFPKLEKVETGGGKLIVVKGNQKFNKAESLQKQFAEVAGKKVLEIECSPDNEISMLSQLNGCTKVSGDLVLKGTIDDSKVEITRIGGCLKVTDTSLKSLSFLNLDQSPSCSTESEISGNKELCLSMSVVKNLIEKIGNVNYKPDEACEIFCSQSEFEESEICNSLDGNLEISGFDSNNGQGTALSKIMAKVRRITGKLTISGNTDATIEFPELVSVGNPSLNEITIHVHSNQNLKGISFPKLKSVERREYRDSIAIVVSGFNMTKDQAKFFNDVAREKELGFNLECDFGNAEVTDFAELNYCTSVKGDLLLKNTKGGIDTQIYSIGGCLRVIDTDLNWATLRCLVSPLQSEKCQSGEKSLIKPNKGSCIEWNEINEAKDRFQQPIEFSFDESCEFSCTVEQFTYDGSLCNQFDGDLTINGETDPKISKAVFEKVKHVKGSLKISDTLLEEIEFPLLSLIENPEPGPTLTLTGNNVLRKFTMPNLKKITSSNSDAVYISHNDGFRMSNELKTVLEAALTPGDTVVYECHESGEISDFSRLEGCTGMSSDLSLKGQISGNVPISKIEYIAGCLKVENTDLSSLDFLKTDGATGDLELQERNGPECEEEYYIKNNENLCIAPFLERQLQEIYPQLKISDNKPRNQCPVFCNSVNGTIPDHECNVVKGELRIENNCSFDQNLAFVEQIYGGLVVKDCSLSSLKEVLPKLRNISNSGIPLVLENVENYSNLTDLIQFKLESENSEGHLLKIVTNLEIPYMVVADLKAYFGSKRVEVSKIEQIPDGVCIFVDPAEEVKNCKKIEGDLILNEKTTSVSTELTEITGCLVVGNTNMENYKFLTKIEKVGEKCRWNSGETEIFNNSCIPYEIRRRTSGKIKELVETEDNKKECFECTGGIIQGQECKVIIGDLEINKGSAPEVVTQLEGVKEIYGRLIIKNSNLPQISLPELTKIDASESEEPAIEITGNTELSTLQIPLLANATSKGKVLVKIEGNKKLKKTAELTEKLGKATGSQCGEGKDTACQFSQVKEASKASDDKEKTTEEGVSKTVLIVLGIIGAILLVVGVGGMAVMVVLMKKKGAKKAKKGKGPGKPPMSTMSKIDSKQFPKLPSGDDKISKTKSMAVENGPKSQSEKKNVSKDGAKGEETKEPADQKKEGAAEENAPQNVPNAS